ncbi:MAG: hypothetical protein BWY21_00108 [Parcubacteria group bacterium ADurb.Bin216]|nr:MAG: hypothetical protein BWY21_00108 [Parcubacteria group bacterium ADurb.Bin216]
MALAFGNTKGKAIKNSHEAYTYKDGENTVRLVGGILPRYVYWVKGTNNKDIPIECLAFSREKEKFDNLEVDFVQSYFPDKKCSWSYSINCIDPTDGKVKVLNLKKKLFEQIMSAAEDLSDPTDEDTGWDIVFKRAKTGPLAFNVEYTLSVLRCKKRALTEAEREAVSKALPIDDKFIRPTPEEVKALCEKIISGSTDESGSESETEAVNELG